MINEKDIELVKKQIEEMQRKIKDLEKPKTNLSIYESIKQIDNFRVTSRLTIKFVQSTTNDEPSLANDEIALWKNTKTTKYYLKANFNGTNKKVELT